MGEASIVVQCVVAQWVPPVSEHPNPARAERLKSVVAQ
jgi:hypothetical protein